MYITNRPEIATIATEAGVDRIFVDLETIGKAERQKGMDTVQSNHTINDIGRIKAILKKGELLVRSNPIHNNSNDEIKSIIDNGADVVMLPFFKTVNEAAKFIDLINGKAKVNLLIETAEAVSLLDSILDLEGIDEIHIGLNDLHLAYKMKFMFELLTDGTVEKISKKVLAKKIKFGFGGIAKLGHGIIPAEMIIKEHYRLGSTCAILSRSFCNCDEVDDMEFIKSEFVSGLRQIRDLEKEAEYHMNFFQSNKMEVNKNVNLYISNV